MNYLATGNRKEGGTKEALQGLTEFKFVVDSEGRTATIPGTGDEKIALTAVEDVGKFVAAVLDDEWVGQESTMAGEVTTWNEVLKVAEEVTGAKFTVTYKSLGDIQRELAAKASEGPDFLLEVLGAMARGYFGYEPVLNKKHPEVAPIAVRQFVGKWWAE